MTSGLTGSTDQVSQFCLENRVVGECTEIGFQIVEKNCRAITSKLIENDCENAIEGTDGDGRVGSECVLLHVGSAAIVGERTTVLYAEQSQ